MDKLKQVLSGSDSPDEERSGIIPQVKHKTKAQIACN